MGKPLNVLAFLLGLALAFPLFADASQVVQAIDGLYYEIESSSYQVQTDTTATCYIDPSFTNNYQYYSSINTVIYNDYRYGSECGTYGTNTYTDYYRYYVITVCGSTPCAPPEPDEPSTCSNGVPDGDETGIDCGGSCINECNATGCYPPAEYRTASDGTVSCAVYADVNSFGQCPSGYFKTPTMTDCVALSSIDFNPPSWFDDGSPPVEGGGAPVLSTDPPPDYVPGPGDDPNQGAFSSTTFNYAESVVDNGDGTETATISKVTTNPDGTTSTSTTSVNRPSGSAAGTGITADGEVEEGFEGEKTEEIPDEAVPGATEAPGPLDFGDKLETTLASVQNEFELHISKVMQHDMIDSLKDVLTPPDINPPAPSLSVSMGGYGVHQVDFGQTASLWSILNAVLITCAYITGAYIVLRKK